MCSKALGWAVEDFAAHETCAQIDHQSGCPSSVIEIWIEFDQIDGSDEATVAKELHDEMSFAECRATWHGCSNSGRNIGVKKINIEA